MELSEIGVARLHCRVGQADAEHGRVALERNSPDQHAAETEEAGLGEGFDNVADIRVGARE